MNQELASYDHEMERQYVQSVIMIGDLLKKLVSALFPDEGCFPTRNFINIPCEYLKLLFCLDLLLSKCFIALGKQSIVSKSLAKPYITLRYFR